jgi:hypothetical protein
MEGSWTGLAAWLAATLAGCALVAGASGCGDDESGAADPGTVQTAEPERVFAPVVEVAAGEPWRPMGARWFYERSTFWFAEDEGCPDRKIAVGRTMPEQRTVATDWIFPRGLGGWLQPAYYRNPQDATCESDFDLRFAADELTRPRDPGPRAAGIRPGEGFYLDLVDAQRPGPRPVGGEVAVPAYAERTDEGDGGVRLTYWMLFGMHGAAGSPGAHEGDWERMDVLLRDAGDDRYEPLAIQLGVGREGPLAPGVVETPWRAPRSVDGHRPVVSAARDTHALSVARAESCSGCLRWETWRSLSDVRKEPWYGFGGAWGQPGPTDATTGPLGPHGFWPGPGGKRPG